MVTHLLILCAVLVAAGCTSFEASIGVGYRKCPPGFEQPILPQIVVNPSSAEREKVYGITPEQVLKVLEYLDPKVLFPEGNRVDLGVWTEIRAHK